MSADEFNQDMDYLIGQQRIHVKILIQPNTKSRFRYPCEGRSAGSVLGANTSTTRKTYPTITVYGLSDDKKVVEVIVSCLMEASLKTHPHKLVGLNCENGICRFKVELCKENNAIVFKQMGIQCVKRTHVVASLELREAIGVDPFNMGFSHQRESKSMDLSAVRLCFQLSILDERGQVDQILEPVVSDVIHDKKSVSDLAVKRISECAGSARGGTTVILLCEKVTSQNIKVVFFREESGERVWEAEAHILDLHKQVAITFTTPPYCDTEITNSVLVFLQLVRKSDNAFGDPRPFEYYPDTVKTTSKPWNVNNFDNYYRRTPLHSITNPTVQNLDSQSWERLTDSIPSHQTKRRNVDTLFSPDPTSLDTCLDTLYSHNKPEILYSPPVSIYNQPESPHSSLNPPSQPNSGHTSPDHLFTQLNPSNTQLGPPYTELGAFFSPPETYNTQLGVDQPGFLHNQSGLPYNQTRTSDFQARSSNPSTDSLYAQTCSSFNQPRSSSTQPNSSITQLDSLLIQSASSFSQSDTLLNQSVSSFTQAGSWITKQDSSFTNPGCSQSQPGASYTQTRVPYNCSRSLDPLSMSQGAELHPEPSYTEPETLPAFSQIQPARLNPRHQNLEELDHLNFLQDPVQRTEQECDEPPSPPSSLLLESEDLANFI